MRIGAIEAGGTKFVCGVGNEEGVIEFKMIHHEVQKNLNGYVSAEAVLIYRLGATARKIS